MNQVFLDEPVFFTVEPVFSVNLTTSSVSVRQPTTLSHVIRLLATLLCVCVAHTHELNPFKRAIRITSESLSNGPFSLSLW